MTKDGNKFDFAGSINRLEEINAWFQHEDSNLDEGLEKLKEGKELIKKCREKLRSVENEFVKIKQEYSAETGQGDSHTDGHTHTVRRVQVTEIDDVTEEEIPLD